VFAAVAPYPVNRHASGYLGKIPLPLLIRRLTSASGFGEI
jgi:hypothetical protein